MITVPSSKCQDSVFYFLHITRAWVSRTGTEMPKKQTNASLHFRMDSNDEAFLEGSNWLGLFCKHGFMIHWFIMKHVLSAWIGVHSLLEWINQ